jgi:hypothetical protein
MIDDKIGPQYRSRFAEEYAPPVGDDGKPQETYARYGFSGEDPYKADLDEQARAGVAEGGDVNWEEWAEKDPEGYASAYYTQWAETDPDGYSAYYASLQKE